MTFIRARWGEAGSGPGVARPVGLLRAAGTKIPESYFSVKKMSGSFCRVYSLDRKKKTGLRIFLKKKEKQGGSFCLVHSLNWILFHSDLDSGPFVFCLKNRFSTDLVMLLYVLSKYGVVLSWEKNCCERSVSYFLLVRWDKTWFMHSQTVSRNNQCDYLLPTKKIQHDYSLALIKAPRMISPVPLIQWRFVGNVKDDGSLTITTCVPKYLWTP